MSGVPATTSLPTVALASLAVHGAVALALVSLPLPTSIARELHTTWMSFDVDVAPSPPEWIAAPPPPPAPIAPRERPAVRPTAPREVAPQTEIHAPPAIDDVFAEPPPPVASLTTESSGAFAVAAGEVGGVPGGVPGGHGTSLVSTVRTATEMGPSDADRRLARRAYVHAIEQLIRTHARYPRAAGREGLEGRVELALRIGHDGHVLAVRVASTSGHGVLDDAALDAAHEIDRVAVPPLVASLTSTDEVRVGVVYVVR